MRQKNSFTETDPQQNEKWMGIWIRQTRLEKNWSQDGLCKGICAVSYLSKIEQGKVIPAPEILHALAAKLDSRWEQTRMSLIVTRNWLRRSIGTFLH